MLDRQYPDDVPTISLSRRYPDDCELGVRPPNTNYEALPSKKSTCEEFPSVLSSTASGTVILAQWGASPPLAMPVSGKPEVLEGVMLALKWHEEKVCAEIEATGLALGTSPVSYCCGTKTETSSRRIRC